MKLPDFIKKKQESSKIAMLTCYDYPSACIIGQSSINCVLVGDSVAMTIHGHPNTLMATIEMMVLHTQAVAKGLTTQFLVTDLPFLSHRMGLSATMQDVKQIMQAGAHAIKIEGGDEYTYETIGFIVKAGVPVMGHLGLTPQYIHQLGGFKVQGKNKLDEDFILQQALALEKAGCFALVLECIPQKLAKDITKSLKIPTIGIGAGAHTDGQVLVWHDLLGLQNNFNPRFVKKFHQAETQFLQAINTYAEQVHNVHFPTSEYAFD